MVKLLYAIPAADILIDSQDNTATLVRMIEQITPPHFPFTLEAIKVLTLWHRDGPQDREFRVRAVPCSSGGVPLKEAMREATLVGDGHNHRWLINFPMWVAVKPEIWRIEFTLEVGKKWETVGEITIPVVAGSPPNAKR